MKLLWKCSICYQIIQENRTYSRTPPPPPPPFDPPPSLPKRMSLEERLRLVLGCGSLDTGDTKQDSNASGIYFHFYLLGSHYLASGSNVFFSSEFFKKKHFSFYFCVFHSFLLLCKIFHHLFIEINRVDLQKSFSNRNQTVTPSDPEPHLSSAQSTRSRRL